jgi:EAL domain-containing protein (putative c-di-GMP-specific phosphodiesterase class I)
VVRIETGEVESAETLIRWKKSDGRLVYPSQFLSLSEEAGVAIPLDEWILRTVAKQRSRFEIEGASALRLNNLLPFFWHEAMTALRHSQKQGLIQNLELEVSERTCKRLRKRRYPGKIESSRCLPLRFRFRRYPAGSSKTISVQTIKSIHR